MVTFFRKKPHFKYAKYDSTSSLRRIHVGREQPEGKDVQAKNSLRLQRDMTLSLCHITYKLLAKTNPPSSNSLRQRKTRWNNIIVETKTNIQTYKYANILSKLCLLHKPHVSSSNKKLKGLERPITFRAWGRQPEEHSGTETP
jgi:ABC-type metal ion transport system substrate-binding protein